VPHAPEGGLRAKVKSVTTAARTAMRSQAVASVRVRPRCSLRFRRLFAGRRPLDVRSFVRMSERCQRAPRVSVPQFASRGHEATAPGSRRGCRRRGARRSPVYGRACERVPGKILSSRVLRRPKPDRDLRDPFVRGDPSHDGDRRSGRLFAITRDHAATVCDRGAARAHERIGQGRGASVGGHFDDDHRPRHASMVVQRGPRCGLSSRAGTSTPRRVRRRLREGKPVHVLKRMAPGPSSPLASAAAPSILRASLQRTSKDSAPVNVPCVRTTMCTPPPAAGCACASEEASPSECDSAIGRGFRAAARHSARLGSRSAGTACGDQGNGTCSDLDCFEQPA
jgi:hypothetical protein